MLLVRRHITRICTAAFILLVTFSCAAQTGELSVKNIASPTSFPIISSKTVASFYFDSSDAKVTGIAAKAFVEDVKMITGRQIKLTNRATALPGNTIIAGTIGQSAAIDELITKKQLDITPIKGKWESFIIKVIGTGTAKKLVIAGSDRRGTAYGIFHLSRVMGVSPFVWWADVTPAKKNELHITASYTSASPSVKYRGLFINDEDWGLQPWAAKHMDTDIKDIGPKTYAKVFELMLRLKANYIWPAMHPCTKAFYYYKENPKVADDYAIIVGGSHCEPMLRNNVFEWAENFEHEYGKKPGEWRYDLNKDEMYKYWDDRVKESVNYESVYTVGMRGIHDGSMPGPKDPDEKLNLLAKVILDQRKMLNLNFAKPASGVPQIFVPYKEVLSLYRRGLQLDDDITIIWPDDNHGYIRQLPNASEQKRSGGHGVYYHLSYWGAPQDYLWLSSISPALISYEMSKAYKYGADRLWVFNVGDIKPAELELQFAMDLAWDVNKWSPAKAADYTKAWAAEIFGDNLANEIAAIKNEYYKLAQSGKPEHINNVAFTREQMRARLERYADLAAKATDLREKVPARLKDAYDELILYSVVGAMLMNEKILHAKLSFYSPAEPEALFMHASLSKEAYLNIESLTKDYNKDFAKGKWDGIMSWHPRDQPVFKMPPISFDSITAAKKDSLEKAYFRTADPDWILSATDYMMKVETQNKDVQKIDGLGINGKALASYSTKSSTDTTPVYVEYVIPAKVQPGNYTIVVKCLPVFDVDHSKNLRFSVVIDRKVAPVTLNVHAEADSREWRENVVRGYSAARMNCVIPKGYNLLRLFIKDNNVVINTIEFYKQ